MSQESPFKRPIISDVGLRMSGLTGVRAIMKDIVETLRQGGEFFDLSAGNPVLLPKVAQMWQEISSEVIASQSFASVVGRYGSSKGYQPLLEAILNDFNQSYGTTFTEKNIVVTPGSQSLFFLGSNIFSGLYSDPVTTQKYDRKILLPLLPDYTGYGGITLSNTSIIGTKPLVSSSRAEHTFKYSLDDSQLSNLENIGAMIVSRPNNPTGNIISEAEIKILLTEAKKRNIPLFIDAAYGGPFPGLNFAPCKPVFDDHIVHCITLSKAGLPGERIAFAIGHESIIQAIESFMTNACIHASRFGQALLAEAITSKRIYDVCRNAINPYYQNKLLYTKKTLYEVLPDSVPWHVYQAEGGMFVWLWFEGLPISDSELYELLKKERVIVVPGSSFFPGLHEPWQHSRQCLRLSLTATEEEIFEAVCRLSLLLQKIYS
jgi:valine--pyruvate aminotransferase